MAINLTLAGTSKDGYYQFDGVACKEEFLDFHFQLRLPLFDPCSNTGVLFNEGGES